MWWDQRPDDDIGFFTSLHVVVIAALHRKYIIDRKMAVQRTLITADHSSKPAAKTIIDGLHDLRQHHVDQLMLLPK